jgi:hypothetical protein
VTLNPDPLSDQTRTEGEDRRMLVILAVAADVAYVLLLVWSAGQIHAVFDGLFDGLPAWLFVALLVVPFIPAATNFMLMPFEDLIDWRRNRETDREKAAMLTAAAAGDLARVTAAVRAQPSLVNAGDETGRTALHLAAEKDQTDLARFLLDNGADPFALTGQGQTPMDVALTHNAPGVGRIILSHVRRSLSRT